MAGSRVHKIGTIFSRTKGLLRSGALGESEKPLWYELYEAFPPRYEPSFGRPIPDKNKEIRNILYPEDVIRAKFYKKYQNQYLGIFNLNEMNEYPAISKLFVDEYLKLEAEGGLSDEELMIEASLSLEKQGIYLDRLRIPGKTDATNEMPQVDSNIGNENILPTLSLSNMFSQEAEKIDTERVDPIKNSSSSNLTADEIKKEPLENTSKLKSFKE